MNLEQSSRVPVSYPQPENDATMGNITDESFQVSSSSPVLVVCASVIRLRGPTLFATGTCEHDSIIFVRMCPHQT